MKKQLTFLLFALVAVVATASNPFDEKLPSINALKAMTFEVGEVTAKTTDTEVVVPINVTKNDGYVSGIITLEWDKDKLELTGVEYSALAPNNMSAPVSNKGTYKIAFGDDYGTVDFTGTGTFFTLTFKIPAGSVAGTIPITLSNPDIWDAEIEEVMTTMKAGSVTLIGGSGVVLDENDTKVPDATVSNVDIVVKRKIAANRWSTICLPFNMTEAQVYAAFGNDVKLQEFVSYDASYDASDKVTSILVHFIDTDMSDGIYANYPYLIKTSQDISEFSVNSTIEPDEEGAVVEYHNGKSGTQRKVWGSLIGTYHAQTTVPANGLFLSENKFWYSDGTTKMKAFRAYFMFDDVLSSVGSAGAKISMVFDNETTGVGGLGIEQISDSAVYNIQGQLVGRDIDMKRLPGGIYIMNGKKIVVTK